MAEQAATQSQRKAALREIRRRQRYADTLIERIERRLFALLDRKSLVDEEDAIELYEKYYLPFVAAVKEMEKGFIDFYGITTPF